MTFKNRATSWLTVLATSTVVVAAAAACTDEAPKSGDAGAQGPSSVVLAEADNDGIREAIYAVFDAPLDMDDASAHVCAERRRPSDAVWDMKVDSYTANATAVGRVDATVVLTTGGGARLPTAVVLTKIDGEWKICG